jgi:hypothetical protein
MANGFKKNCGVCVCERGKGGKEGAGEREREIITQL